MIVQKVIVRSLATIDGKYKLAASAEVGKEGWVVPTTITKHREWGFIVALAEDLRVYVPVELLEFTNEFNLQGS